MLRIHLLGYPQIFDENVPLPPPTPNKGFVLWAYLLLNGRRSIPRDHLAYTLWPDTAEPNARANLRRHLHLLRKYLPDAPLNLPWILSTRQTVQWNPDADYELDVATLELFDGETAVPAQWTTLIESYHGDLMEGFYDDWILAERTQLRQRYGRLLQQRSAAQTKNNDLPGAIRTTKRLLAFDPLREETYRKLMRLHYRAGDRAAALETFRQCQTALQTEMDVPPMPETLALRDTIVNGDDHSPPPPAPAPPVSRQLSNPPAPLVADTAVSIPSRRPFPAKPIIGLIALAILLIAANLLLAPRPAPSTTLSLSGTAVVQDTWLNSETPELTYDPLEGETPYHQYPDVHLTYFSYPLDRVLIRFNLGQLPDDARITQAIFRLRLEDYVNVDLPDPLPADVSAFRLLRDWQPETAAFNVPWSQPGLAAGVDYDNAPLGTQSIHGGDWVSFDVTAVAQNWLADPEQNNGLLVMITRAPQGAHYWVHTADYPLADQRPQLEITYSAK